MRETFEFKQISTPTTSITTILTSPFCPSVNRPGSADLHGFPLHVASVILRRSVVFRALNKFVTHLHYLLPEIVEQKLSNLIQLKLYFKFCNLEFSNFSKWKSLYTTCQNYCKLNYCIIAKLLLMYFLWLYVLGNSDNHISSIIINFVIAHCVNIKATDGNISFYQKFGFGMSFYNEIW